MNSKPKVYLTSPVFFEIAEHDKVSQKFKDRVVELKGKLYDVAELILSEKRFPEKNEIAATTEENNVDFIGCHLSHPISEQAVAIPSLKAVCTSTAGFNHVSLADDLLVTHTPGVLDDTVADYTIAIILANLRNVVKLHNFLWSENWSPDQKWDLDENLNNVIDNKIVGIVGLGEIGVEVAKRLLPWGLDVVYYDINRNRKMEEEYDNLTFQS